MRRRARSSVPRPTRSQSLRNRLGTRRGRRDAGGWCGAVILVGAAAATGWAIWVNNQIVDTSEQWAEAWDLLVAGEPGEPLARAAVTVLAVICVPVVVSALVVAVRRRPWRPHLGGAHLRGSVQRPVRDITRSPTLPADLAAPVTSDRPPARPSGGRPAGPPPAVLEESLAASGLHPGPVHPGGPPAETPQTDDVPALLDGPGEEDGGQLEPVVVPSRRLDEIESMLAAPAAGQPEAADSPEEAEKVFFLCGKNPGMRTTREELLAVVWVSQGRIELGEAARIMDRGASSVRMLLRRATEDGWLDFMGGKYWRLDDEFATDLDLLDQAVSDDDLELAETVAKGFGPPLPRLDAAWLDHYVAGPTPREEITSLADRALAEAVERWPDSRLLRTAVDRLYPS